MVFLLELCSLDIPHSLLLRSFSSLVELLKSLASDTGDIFSKVGLLSGFVVCYSALRFMQPPIPLYDDEWRGEKADQYFWTCRALNYRNTTNCIPCHCQVDQESWQQPQQPVVLRTWNMESPHNYENSRHETSIFACPGATSFEVEFDERCETEKR